jgi:hypothetical protein
MPELTNSLNIGMLWRNEGHFYPNNKFSQEDHIWMAADYFMKKFGVIPDLVHIPENTECEDQCPDQIYHHGQIIQVKKDRLIQPGHLWIGRQSEDYLKI